MQKLKGQVLEKIKCQLRLLKSGSQFCNGFKTPLQLIFAKDSPLNQIKIQAKRQLKVYRFLQKLKKDKHLPYLVQGFKSRFEILVSLQKCNI